MMVLVPLVTLPWLEQLCIALGAPAGTETLKYAKQYALVVFAAETPFNYMNYGYGNVLRASSRSIFNAVKQVCTSLI